MANNPVGPSIDRYRPPHEPALATGSHPPHRPGKDIHPSTKSAIEGMPPPSSYDFRLPPVSPGSIPLVKLAKPSTREAPGEAVVTMPPTANMLSLASWGKRLKDEQAAKRQVSTPAQKHEARELYRSYLRLTKKLRNDPAGITPQDLASVMTMAEKYFNIDWNEATAASGRAYNPLVQIPPVLNLLLSLIPAYGGAGTATTFGSLTARMGFAAMGFAVPTFLHTFTFPYQFRLNQVAAKTTSDSVKSLVLKDSNEKMHAARMNLEAVFKAEGKGKARSEGGPSQQALDFKKRHDEWFEASKEFAKGTAKFNIESNALHHTTNVRTARTILSLAAALTGYYKSDARIGFFALSVATAISFVLQLFASQRDTANKAQAQFRTTPFASDVVKSAHPDLPYELAEEDIDRLADNASMEDLGKFISALAQTAISSPLEARAGFVQKKFALDKRILGQEIARNAGMPECDSFNRLTYLEGKGDKRSADDELEFSGLKQQYAKDLEPEKKIKNDQLLREFKEVGEDLRILKNPDLWPTLSPKGGAAVLTEMEAFGRPLDTFFAAMREGASDLTKPEQLLPLSLNKMVQSFTVLLGGPTTPQLIGELLRFTQRMIGDAKDVPGYSLPGPYKHAGAGALVLGGLLAIYGSRFGPRAATHTVQYRSDFKNAVEEGRFNIPVGWKMYGSGKFWNTFFKNAPGSVGAQVMVDVRLAGLQKNYRQSRTLLDEHADQIDAFRQELRMPSAREIVEEEENGAGPAPARGGRPAIEASTAGTGMRKIRIPRDEDGNPIAQAPAFPAAAAKPER